MKKIYANNLTTLSLGRQGENLARQVVFDIRDLESLYGSGTVEVIHQRPGDAQPYPLAVQRDGTLVTWDVTATDTEMSAATANERYGKCELRYYAGETLAKSQIWRTWVESAMGTPSETTPPEPEQGWVEQVLATGVAAQQAADAAKADADRAQGVIQDVNAAGSAAVQSVQTAGDAQVQRVTDEGATQTANAKAQADAAAQSAAGAAQSAQQAAESAAVYDTVVSDVNQLKQDVAAITPDDTTVDGKPWTSKKIVDSLCQPIEESGNPVQVYPVEGYPLGVKVSWEPTQEGEGDPSPNNIRPITGRDAVSVTRCGKNLVDFPHNVKVSTLANSYKAYNVYIRGITDVLIQWKFTGTAANTAGCIAVYYNDGSKEIVAYWGTNIGSKKITKPVKAISLEDWNGKNGDMILEYLQIELGSTATPYEPYTGSTTDIALPETVYGGEVDAVNGEVAETFGLVTLDGSEEWYVSGKLLGNKTDWYYVSSKIPNAVNAAPNKGNDICSHYPHADVVNTNTVQGCAIVWGAIRVRWGDTIPDDADAWKAYLAAQYAAGTPVQVAYKLAEPVPFTATSTQPISSLSGVNTLYTDAGTLTVTGREDPKHTITELKNAIISLGGNV